MSEVYLDIVVVKTVETSITIKVTEDQVIRRETKTNPKIFLTDELKRQIKSMVEKEPYIEWDDWNSDYDVEYVEELTKEQAKHYKIKDMTERVPL